jgi:hypothetical protein
MKTKTQIKTIADGIYAEAQKNIANYIAARGDVISKLADKTLEEQVAILYDLVSGVEAQIVAPRVNSVGLPKHITKVNAEITGTTVDAVTISIRSKLKAATKYRKDTTVRVNADFIKNAGAAIIDALYEMYYIAMANENLDALNERVAEIIKANEIPYTFKFALEPDNSAVVLSITDDEVVFNASSSAALSIAQLTIFVGGNEYNDIVRREAEEKLVNTLKGAQTTVQLIKAKATLIDTITDVITKKRAVKLIRQSYHRQAKNLEGLKSGIGYFNEEVEIAGELVEIFALVKKAEDGTKSVILKPFDVKTNLVVDYDVLAAL